jgi:type I restriction enzyme, S subunit
VSFPTYAHYKDSGVEWLGEVPAHWGLKPLKHLVDFRSGGTPDKTNREFWDGDVPWASAKDLKTDELFDTIDHITETAVSAGAASLVEPGSILVVVRGMILARLFPVVTARVPMAINQDLKALSVKPQIHPDFMAWMLRGSEAETLSRLDEAGHGTKALRMEAWGAMRLPVPDLSEQVRIVDFLKVETTKLDALITEQRTLIDLLKEKRQAVISHAVTKGLDSRVPMKDSGVEWLGEVPAHWRMTRLGFIASQINDINHEMPEAVAEGVPFLSAKDLDDYGNIDFDGDVKLISEDDFERLSRKICPRRGDIVYSRIGTIGRACVVRSDVKFLVSYSCCIVRVESSDVFLDFLRDLLASDLILTESKSRIRSMGQPDLGLGEIRRFPIPLPPIDEQMAIDKHLKIEIGGIDKLLSESQNAITLLQERRTALISAAVTGKIDVRQHATEAA